MPGWVSGLMLVGAGGFAGAIVRHAGVEGARAIAGIGSIWAILAVNAVGCLVVGGMLGWYDASGGPPERVRLLLAVGFLGSLTTFSAFSAETFHMLREGRHLLVALHIALSVGLCIGAVAVGFAIGKSIAPSPLPGA